MYLISKELLYVHASFILYIKNIYFNITKQINRVGLCTVHPLSKHCGLWQCRDENGLRLQAYVVYFMGVFLVFDFYFFIQPQCAQCNGKTTPRKRQNRAQERGVLSVFPSFGA